MRKQNNQRKERLWRDVNRTKKVQEHIHVPAKKWNV